MPVMSQPIAVSGMPQDRPRASNYEDERRRRSTGNISLNDRPRQRRRLPEVQRCCNCTRFGTCSANRRTICECRAARRECLNCCADRRCRNRPSAHAVRTPPPGDGTFCPPVTHDAETPTRRNTGRTGRFPGSHAARSTATEEITLRPSSASAGRGDRGQQRPNRRRCHRR